MTTELYPLANAAQVPLLGRVELLASVVRRLTKPTADHLSVVGPPYIGKTTLLRHLATSIGETGQNYICSVFLDLRHHTPSTDHEFRQRLLLDLHAALTAANHESAELIDTSPEDGDLADALAGVFDYLDTGRILVVMDGLDHVLRSPSVSKNLWDYLRELGLKSSCTFVTGTRHRIRELCNDPASLASEFWNIFADPLVLLGPFDDSDWDHVLAPLQAHVGALENSARNELREWTGGHPALVALLGHTLVSERISGTGLNGDHVRGCGTSLSSGSFELVTVLWDDCPIEVQGDLYALAMGTPGAEFIPNDRVRIAAQRGFMVDGRRPRIGSKLIAEIAKSQGQGTQDLRRLFGTEASYGDSFPSLPEFRLGLVRGGDSALRRAVEGAIRNIEYDPGASLLQFRIIADRALTLIYSREAPGNRVPEDWMTEWKATGNRWAENLSRGRLPGDPGRQCGLLDEITSDQGGKRKLAQFVKRPTYCLIEHVKQIGDLGAHPDGAVTAVYAATACLAAVELLDRLASELP
jgi:hypothetical protein